MIKIDIKKDCKGNLEIALKKYKTKYTNTKVLNDVRNYEHFAKKSIEKREQIKKAKYLEKKKNGSN